MKLSLFIIVQLCLSLLLQSCSNREALPEPYPADSLGRINRWILDSMRLFYYWSAGIPAATNDGLAPRAYFESLLAKEDRFSWISNGRDVQPPSSSYFTYGFHYALVEVAGYEGYIGVVTDVNAGGGAAQAGLKRGDYFIAVNGERMSVGNVNAIHALLRVPGELKLTVSNSSWQAADTVAVHPAYAHESPIRLTRVFRSRGITTGYLYYNAFNEAYDPQLLEAFSQLKQAGTTELILDLRYNAGGSVASAAKMAAMIAAKLSAGETYAIYQGNSLRGKRSNTLQAVLNTSGSTAGRHYAALQEHRLPLQRVFILTSNGTASAAEMVIHNLKPFIPVIQIGETTTGKDEAAFTIIDRRTPREVEWTLQPVVYKLFNKNGEGNYAAGLQPQYPLSETSALPLGAFGTANDLLVRQALEIIYGTDLPGNPQNLRRTRAGTIYSSAAEDAGRAAPVLITE